MAVRLWLSYAISSSNVHTHSPTPRGVSVDFPVAASWIVHFFVYSFGFPHWKKTAPSVIDLKTCFLLKLLLGEWFAFIIFAVFEFKFHQKEIVSRVASLDVFSTRAKQQKESKSIRNVITHARAAEKSSFQSYPLFDNMCSQMCCRSKCKTLLDLLKNIIICRLCAAFTKDGLKSCRIRAIRLVCCSLFDGDGSNAFNLFELADNRDFKRF